MTNEAWQGVRMLHKGYTAEIKLDGRYTVITLTCTGILWYVGTWHYDVAQDKITTSAKSCASAEAALELYKQTITDIVREAPSDTTGIVAGQGEACATGEHHENKTRERTPS